MVFCSFWPKEKRLGKNNLKLLSIHFWGKYSSKKYMYEMYECKTNNFETSFTLTFRITLVSDLLPTSLLNQIVVFLYVSIHNMAVIHLSENIRTTYFNLYYFNLYFYLYYLYTKVLKYHFCYYCYYIITIIMWIAALFSLLLFTIEFYPAHDFYPKIAWFFTNFTFVFHFVFILPKFFIINFYKTKFLFTPLSLLLSQMTVMARGEFKSVSSKSMIYPYISALISKLFVASIFFPSLQINLW